MPSDISMSASPPDQTPGRTPGRTPNSGAPYIRKKPKAADPLVRPKKKPTQKAPTSNGVPQLPNGLRPPSFGPPPLDSQPLARPRPPPPSSLPAILDVTKENKVSGFSSAPVGQVKEHELRLSKRALMEGFRYHVARFSSKKAVDPRDKEDFVRPVRLHRKHPRSLESQPEMNDEESKEAEIKAEARAERDRRRESENAKVAPSVGGSKQRGVNLKKTEQVYRTDQTEEQKARSKLRYEEALPWMLEDFEGKSTWQSTYEEALSNNYAMFIQDKFGVFRVAPLEKWYKFTQKNQFKTLTSEEAEMRFNRRTKEPRWFQDTDESRKKKQEDLENRKAGSGLFIGKWERGGGGSGSAAPITKHENADADDLDFVEDRFADDEENMLFEEDDETKEAEDRIKKDQLQANVFDLKEEKEYEKQEQLEKKEKETEKKLGKKVKKALMKREKNYIYDSDSGSNPYSSSSGSDSDSTETERRKAAEEKEKAKDKNDPKTSPEKHPEKPTNKSKPKAPSSSGSRTPDKRPSKHASSQQPISRTASSSNLKRAGSPINSDQSGNESARARKKTKKNTTTATAATANNKHLQPTASTTTSKPPSRPTSPPIPSASQAGNKRARAGPGSDNEAGSGGEMSDGARKRQKLKITMGGAAGGSKPSSPPGSRAGSPGAEKKPGSPPNASSPLAQPPADKPAASSIPFPSPEEIRAKIPKEGIPITAMIAHWKGLVRNKEQRDAFIQLMKAHARYDKERKVLLPL